ncbi:DUF2497 domain-containing protein [Croceicoccus sp. F390]|uniref:DUF2497 domain-containing protein n=1 Tax=Croceicoccus esteveae TaxID=3075597 RepID=A0ABU2ZJF7_9SPHN|nr:DUF2497 domain-containing protein [Croceicoccus sp. F390]MDT0576153.1 DUF2497 domain-containing protein [Croceicoccus sp. F390]
MRHDEEQSVEDILQSIKQVIERDEQAMPFAQARSRSGGNRASTAAPPVHEQMPGEQPFSDPDGVDAPLIAQPVEQVMRNSFAALSRAADAAPTSAQREAKNTIEDMVRDMLRPMLKDWLDSNLPAIVEHIVEREVRRITDRE